MYIVQCRSNIVESPLKGIKWIKGTHHSKTKWESLRSFVTQAKAEIFKQEQENRKDNFRKWETFFTIIESTREYRILEVSDYDYTEPWRPKMRRRWRKVG